MMQLGEIDIVQAAIRAAGQHAAERFPQAPTWWRTHTRGLLHDGRIGIDRALDSPAEAVFQLWYDALDYTSETERTFPLIRQVEIPAGGRLCRLDFRALWVTPAKRVEFTPIVIEIDGHAFHERTREQVTEGHRRDRALQAAGLVVLHYSFDELMHDPRAAAEDALRCVGAWAGRDSGDVAARCA
jgi:hypothetical protein